MAPDVFVVLGAPRHKRPSYLLWEEPQAPDFVLEITSRGTRGEDQGRKRELYRRLGVAEYWQYDPTGDCLEPALQGLELVDGTLVLTSTVLELELRLTERGFRFHDPVSGGDLPDIAETDAAWQRAEQRWHRAERDLQRERQARDREGQARQAAEARVAELEARLRDRRNSER